MDTDIIKRYDNGERGFGQENLYQAKLAGAGLSGANLHEANLYEADLSGAKWWLAGGRRYGPAVQCI